MGWRFLVVYMALFVPFAIATPYLQKLLALRGFREDQIGVVLGCFELMAVLAPPLWGLLSDWSGRPRLVLTGCVCGMIPAFMLFGVASGTVAGVAVAFLFGLFNRPLAPLTDGITFRFINARGGDYGKVRIGASMAFVASLLVLERLGIGASRDGQMIFRAMVVAGGLQLISLLLIPSVSESAGVHRAEGGSRAEHGVALRALCTRQFLCFMLCAFLGRLTMMSYYGFFTLYLAEVHGVEKAGLVWLIGPICEMPLIFYSRRIMDRIGVRNLFALGILGCAVRFTGFGIAPGLWMVIPLQTLHALTFGAYHCSSVTYVSRCVPQSLQSTAQTLFSAVTVGGGGILGGAIGGLVARHYGFRALYTSFGAVAAATLILLMLTVPALTAGERATEGDR